MLDICKNESSICKCVDWGAEVIGPVVEHLLQNYELDYLDLDYASLDEGSKIRLCQIGHCRQCGGRICVKTEIQACELIYDTMRRIYDTAEEQWRMHQEDKYKDFRKTFIQLFRGRDQQVARLWLDLLQTKAEKQGTGSETELC